MLQSWYCVESAPAFLAFLGGGEGWGGHFTHFPVFLSQVGHRGGGGKQATITHDSIFWQVHLEIAWFFRYCIKFFFKFCRKGGIILIFMKIIVHNMFVLLATDLILTFFKLLYESKKTCFYLSITTYSSTYLQKLIHFIAT